MDERLHLIQKHRAVLIDVSRLAEYEAMVWSEVEEILRKEGVPTAITSGYSQYAMAKILDHSDGKTSWTMPATVAMALATTAPTSTTTGATLVEAAYTSYTRVTTAGAVYNAATAATPSVVTNASTITFPNCTGSTSTLLGFMIADNASTGAGNSLFYGTLTSVTISTTQTPPTASAGSVSLSLTGT